MTPRFTTLLVPTDFTINTEIGIKKALEIADFGAIIHLLHIRQFTLGGLSRFADNKRKQGSNVEIKLQQWRAAIEGNVKNIAVSVWIPVSDSDRLPSKNFRKKLLLTSLSSESTLYITGNFLLRVFPAAGL